MPRPKQPQPEPTPQTDPGDSATPDDEQVELIEIDFRGVIFTIPKHADDWDFETIEIARNPDNVWDVMRAIIGPDQYAKLQDKFPKWRDFQQFRDLLFTTCNREVVGL